MFTRRDFLHSVTVSGAVLGVGSLRAGGLRRVEAAVGRMGGRPPGAMAGDESFWLEIRKAFTLDATLINLNNGGVSPSPRPVHEALIRHLNFSNQAPVYHMWELLEPDIEKIRKRLAAEFGCSPEALAITRNASEALQIAQLGIDLEPGDEVVTTNQDYPRMLQTWRQRVRRDGIKLIQVSFPVPPPSLADLALRIERAVTDRTKVIHFCHITNLTGQIFPVRDICRMARARGIRSIVDGAHAFGQFPFKLTELECDYYGTSLHKWLLAPIGTGFLYVRPERIASTWPLQPSPPAMRGIRKFEEIGTHPAANHNAIAEALDFHQSIGVERKAARLRLLKDRWARRLKKLPRVKILTSLDSAQSCAIGLFSVEGMGPHELVRQLWENHRIIVTPIKHLEYAGVRVTPNVYTTVDEIDTFVEAVGISLREMP